jgi:hypothetical protein
VTAAIWFNRFPVAGAGVILIRENAATGAEKLP